MDVRNRELLWTTFKKSYFVFCVLALKTLPQFHHHSPNTSLRRFITFYCPFHHFVLLSLTVKIIRQHKIFKKKGGAYLFNASKKDALKVASNSFTLWNSRMSPSYFPTFAFELGSAFPKNCHAWALYEWITRKSQSIQSTYRPTLFLLEEAKSKHKELETQLESSNKRVQMLEEDMSQKDALIRTS